MDFSLNEEQVLLKDSVEKFIQQQYAFEQREKIVNGDDGFSTENWSLFAELGWLAIPFNEDDGGIGWGPVETMIVMEEFGKGLVVEPYLANVVLAGGLLRRAGNADQKAALLPGLIDGSRQMAFAYAERNSRFNLGNVATTATAAGDGWFLNGTKSVVLNAPAADTIIVSARTAGDLRDPDGVSLFIVDAKADGVTIRAYPTQDGQQAGEVILDGVTLGADALLGTVGQALPVIEAVADEACAALCAEAVGAMGALVQATVEYSKTREQFGVPIGNFQVLQHRMVEMFMEYEQSKSMVYRGTLNLDTDDATRARETSAMKAFIGKAGRFVGQQAVQVHGGMGVTAELNVGHYFKRLTIINQMFGNVDFHTERFNG